MPKIAVAIVAYRSGATLGRCLAALARQTCRDFEVIVVNNGPTPESTYAGDGQIPALRVIEPGRNLGFAAANNLAAREAAADAEWLATLNPDAYPHPDWLQNFMRAMRRHPPATMFGSLQLDACRAGICDGLGDRYHVFGFAWREGRGRPVPRSICEREVFSPCAAAAFYRMAAFKQAGGFDEDFFCYLEDADLGFRLRLLGGSCIQLADAVVDHVGKVSASRGFAAYHVIRNMMWTYIQNMPASLFAILLPGHVAAVGLIALRYAVRGQGRAAATGLRDGVRGIGRARRKRGAIQARRTVPARSLLRVMAWFPLAAVWHACFGKSSRHSR